MAKKQKQSIIAQPVHSFRTCDAERYGVNCAIILYHFTHWIQLNEANGKHCHEGKHWTYSSVKALTSIFTYMSDKQVRVAIEKLISEGVLLKGNYNPKGYDRTTWYTFSDEYGKSICPTGQFHLPHRANPFAPQGEPIPNSITDNITDSIIDNSKIVDSPFKKLMEVYHNWYVELNGMPPHIDALAGKSAKTLMQYFTRLARAKSPDLSNEEIGDNAVTTFKVVLDNYHLLEPYLRSKYKLNEIASNINNIIPQIKKAYEKGKPQKPSDWREIIRNSARG